ncbi:uncharacterized protein LOC112597733 [Melanaphis sacchari]|uniref:uncharacterized protein LOC112597733 n=1 Tax=Melanaphis sacchari TaxID=742174 RepID=UPI000DC13FAA|nr:uncharacterized protein LOC112597733 [Melanaphis sacchari]
MYVHKTNKLHYCLVIFTVFCLSILQTNAGISVLLRDTGVIPAVPMKDLKETATNGPELARIFYSAVGNLVEAVPVFPITFNVPDMVTAFSSMLSGMFNYITGNYGGNGASQPKDVLGDMFNIFRHIAVQEDIHDLEFMT